MTQFQRSDLAAFFAAHSAPKKIALRSDPVIVTSDWEGTLVGKGKFVNATLFEDLSDTLRAGHLAIITSTVDAERYHMAFNAAVLHARAEGYDVLDFEDFYHLSKLAAKEGKLESDYAFDNDPINRQPLSDYVRTAVEVRIEEGGFRSFPRTAFRALMELPPKPEYGIPATGAGARRLG